MEGPKLAYYFNLNQMPPGRHGFAMTGVLKVARDQGLSDLLPLIEECKECARKAQRLTHQWEVTKKKKESGTSSGEAMKAKRSVVRQLTGIHKIIDGRAEGDDDDADEVATLATELAEALFPNGVRGIAEEPYEEMLKTVDMLIEDHLEGSHAKHVEELHLTREVARLKKRNEQLRVELHASPAPNLEYSTVEAGLDETHQATARVMNAVCFYFPYNDARSTKKREALLAPINAQQADVAKARAQHRPSKDVDVDTGDELDTTDQGQTDEGQTDEGQTDEGQDGRRNQT